MLGAKHSKIRRSHAVINARNTSLLHRDAVFLYASLGLQLLDAAFHYAPSDDYTSDAPPRLRVLLRADAYSRLTLVKTCQLRAALLNAPQFNLASDVHSAVATSHLTLVNTFVAVQSSARVNQRGEPGSAAARPAKQSGSRTFYLPEQFQFPEQSARSNNCFTVVQENNSTEQ